MAATVVFSESNGVGESVTDSISNLNFGSTDAPNLNTTSYPITIGNNSYEKYLRVKVSAGTGFTEITNMKFWKSAGTLLTDEVINAAANQTYTQPVATASSKATSAVPTSEGTCLVIQSTEGTPTKFTTAGYSKYIVLQVVSGAGTPSGDANEKTFDFEWDEI